MTQNAAAQRRIDLVKNGNNAELSAAKTNLAKIEREHVVNDRSIEHDTAKTHSQLLDAEADYLSTIQTLNDEARPRA